MLAERTLSKRIGSSPYDKEVVTDRYNLYIAKETLYNEAQLKNSDFLESPSLASCIGESTLPGHKDLHRKNQDS